MKRIEVGSTAKYVDDVNDPNAHIVEIPDDATVSSVTYRDPYWIVQWWRPARRADGKATRRVQ